jgi:CRP-like cAMP-binding protein
VYGRLTAVLQEDLTDAHYQSHAGHKSKAGQPAEPALLEPYVLEPITHRDLAGRIGASREAISRILKTLERSGHLIMSTKRITLLKKLPERY